MQKMTFEQWTYLMDLIEKRNKLYYELQYHSLLIDEKIDEIQTNLNEIKDNLPQ